MLDLRAWSAENHFKDELFIDYVDNNWCWKMVRKNYVVLGTSETRMTHEISEEVRDSKYISLNRYGKVRRYFQMRNSVYHLLHESLTMAQRLYVARAMVIIFASALFSDDRPVESVLQCLRGAAHGLIGRLGAYR
jgi:rhamnosyltransferase